MTPQQVAAAKHAAGLDKALIVQYVEYIKNAISGNFGTTETDNRPVISIIVDNGSATLELAVAASLVAAVVGLGLGVLAGRWRDSGFDIGARLFGIIVYAMPVFFLGLLAQLVFGQELGWLPTSGEASPTTEFLLPVHTHLMVIDAIIAGDWSAEGDVLSTSCFPQ